MRKFLLLAGAILLVADDAYAYSPEPTPAQCQLVRQAVAQYGYAAARKHALENYGPEAVKAGDKCLTKQTERRMNPNGRTAAQRRGEMND